jgi:hypothetical protein
MIKWWSRGDLNPRLGPILRGFQAGGWHKAVIDLAARVVEPYHWRLLDKV